MGEILIQNINDDVIETFKIRAQLSGRTLEEEFLHWLQYAHRPFTPEEKVAKARELSTRIDDVLSSLALDEIRKGLE